MVLCLGVGLVLLWPSLLLAYGGELNAAVQGTGIANKKDVYSIIGLIINIVLGTLGVLLLGVIIYAGILWGLLSQGDPAQIKKAQAMIRNAVIGIILVFASYTISVFVINALTKASSSSSALSPTNTVCQPGTTPSGGSYI